MLAMNISTEDRKDPSHDKLIAELTRLNNAYVTIGFHDDAGTYPDGTDVVTVALANEFGADIENGFGEGIAIHIPERSFIRSTIDEHMNEINQFREEALANMIEKGWSIEKALESVGFKIQVLIQNKIQSNVPPENADSTIAKKEREGKAIRTLMDSRLMLRSVTYKVFA